MVVLWILRACNVSFRHQNIMSFVCSSILPYYQYTVHHFYHLYMSRCFTTNELNKCFEVRMLKLLTLSLLSNYALSLRKNEEWLLVAILSVAETNFNCYL